MTYEVRYLSRDGKILKSNVSSRKPNIAKLDVPFFAVQRQIYREGLLIDMSAVVGTLPVC
ncbi:hypothetical protein [Snodgrassella sp. ESL0324]|uniref:hypothetical protein n=1 Tax=Snodgrassella sp. ESL0324 TaxID=2705033 RepID=UPI001581CDBE|nr:hypothetical protein [Snodgrassella sp. ESL0324]NUF08912.1 hypothetical protein [Snodgrassella sp. ESL0324]